MGLPIINLSLIPTFPAKVTGDGPTTIVKNGLEYVIGWDIETFSVNLNPGANTSLLGFDPDADETGLVPIAEIATPTIDARLADEPTAIAGVNNTDLMTPLRVSDQIEARSTSTVDLAAIGKMPVFVNAFGRPSLHSTGSTYFLSEGAYTDTMNWYFQRQANYTGGGAGDSTAGVLSPIRGETYIGPNVTYAVEAGGVFLSNNRSFLCQSVGSTSQSNVYEGGRGWGSVHEVKTWQKVFSSANGNLTAGQTVFPVPYGYSPNKSTVA